MNEPPDGKFFTDEEREREIALSRVPLEDAPASLPTTKDGKIFFYVGKEERARIERILHELRSKNLRLTTAGALMEVFRFYDEWHRDNR